MAIRSGRVGVRNDQVDVYGRVKTEGLQPKILDSEEIVVDEEENKLYLEQTITNDIARAFKTPLSAPAEHKIVGVDTNNEQTLTAIRDLVYPVGSIYMSMSDVTPSTLFGGTWEALENKFLFGSGTKTVGATGGEENHTLTVNEMPQHDHSLTIGGGSGSVSVFTYADTRQDWGTRTVSKTGSGQAHNNMPPYIVVNMWKRTA